MKFEVSPENEIKRKQKRVDDLKKTDYPHEDSIRDLAMEEDKFREYMKEKELDKKLTGEDINNLSDKYSTAVLREFEERKEKNIDESTGLKNRRALIEEAPKIMSLERRAEKHCSILFIDLDDFKKINDTYGHSAGDEVLVKIAELIKDSVRQSDFCYRIGGDEFVVVLPGMKEKGAKSFAKRIMENVEGFNFRVPSEDGQKYSVDVSVSVGCSSTDTKENKWKAATEKILLKFLEEMIKEADENMYKIKGGKITRS